MFTFLIMIHILICVLLIIVVLMQSAKGEGLAGAFGGGGGVSGAVFGGRGAASFLSRATTVLAVAFMVSCLGLSIMSAGRSVIATGDDGESGVTRSAQQDMEEQRRQMEQDAAAQQSAQDGGTVEDVFQVNPASDSQ